MKACVAVRRAPAATLRRGLAALAFALSTAVAGCDEEALVVPTAEEVASYYTSSSITGVEMKGNVAELTVSQNAAQLRRGGSMWARVGPYIYLLSQPTQEVFRDFNGLAGVRVVTRVGTAEVARALLPRDALNDITWKRALNVNGLARRDGTERPALIEDLIDYGEDRVAEYEYNSRFVR